MQLSNVKRDGLRLKNHKLVTPVQVIAVTSGKGGVGKTNVSVNLSMALTNNGKKVLLLDADLGLANVDVNLGLKPTYNMSHVISGEKTLEDVIVETPNGLKIIPASSGFKNMAELTQFEHAGIINAFNELDNDLDVLLIDTAAGISDSVISFSRAAQEIIVVVCNEPASITDAYAMIKLLSRDYGIFRFRVLVNMVASNQEAIELYQKLIKVTNRYLDVSLDYMGSVPFDEYVKKAIQKRKDVVNAYPRCKASTAYSNLSKKILSWPVPDYARGHLEFFVDRLIKNNREQGNIVTVG